MLSIRNLPEKYKDDATHLANKELEFLFLETGTYDAAVSPNLPIYFLRGEKGSGKSMIFRRIIQEFPKQAVGIYFGDFYFEIKDNVSKHHPSDGNALKNVLYFQEEWLIQLWLRLAVKLYYSNFDSRIFPFDTGNYAELYKFLKKHNLLTRLNWIGKLFLFRPERAKAKYKETEIELTFVKPMKASIKSVDEITIVSQIIEILQKTPIYIVVDEIDVIGLWDESTKASLQGLYNALLILIRSVNTSGQGASIEVQADQQPLRIRVAIREDMFLASKEGYVDSEKLTNESISLTWTLDTLKEIIARPIRSYWKFAPHEIPKEKLLTEIFPGHLGSSDQLTTDLLIDWAKRNPRALNKLIRDILNQAIRRQLAFIDQRTFEPVYVSMEDIHSTIASYSQERLEFLQESYQFVFPRLGDVIGHLRSNSNRLFREDGRGSYKMLSTGFRKYIPNKMM